MKLTTSCLALSLILILPSSGFAQSTLQSNKVRSPKDYAAPEFFGVQLKVTLASGETIKGRVIGWQGDSTAGSLKQNTLMIGIPQTNAGYLELEQKNISRKILLSEITTVTTIKAKHNFFQKVGHGFRKAGYILLGISYTAFIYIVIIIDSIIHGGKPKWDYP